MANVLLIDAEREFAQPLVSALQSWGYGVTWTTDGKEGLDKATNEHPAAIVLCVELPKMSGYSICNKLKKDDSLKDIPLVITSREATNETFEQHKKLKTRAEAYLIKPFKPQDLQQVLAQYAPQVGGAVAPPSQEEDIVLNELPPGAKEEPFDPGALVGTESKERDPLDALEGFEIAGDEDEGDGATRVMMIPQLATLQAQKAAAAAAPQPKPEPVAAPAPAPAPKAQPAAATSASLASSNRPATVIPSGGGRPVTDDERRQLETKLQEAKTKAAQSAQEVDKLRAEMNQLRTKSREESGQLRSQITELTEKMKQEAAGLKQRYEDTTQKAVAEANTLRQQVKDVQARAQAEIESLRGQLIEIRNQSQDLLSGRDSELGSTKKRAAELEHEVENLRAESARNEKLRERTVKAVDVALQLLGEEEATQA